LFFHYSNKKGLKDTDRLINAYQGEKLQQRTKYFILQERTVEIAEGYGKKKGALSSNAPATGNTT